MKNLIKKYLFTNTVSENIIIYLIEKSDFFIRLLPANTMYKKNTYRSVSRNRILYNLDISDYQEYLVYFGLQADSSIPFIKFAPQKEGIYIDIGANIGQTTLNLRQSIIHENTFIYSFEPYPQTFQKLKNNISLNPQFRNIIIENIALGDETNSMAMFQDCASNSGGFRAVKKNDNLPNEIVYVKQMRLDQYPFNDSIVFIKIDVEGYEMEVLKGAKSILSKYKPIMVIEICDKNLKLQHSSAFELITFLQKIGYEDIRDAKTLIPIGTSNLENVNFDILCR